MSKLEEYRDRQAELYEETPDLYSEPDLHWKDGFDAAIALDLPVKFAEWQRHPEGDGLQKMLLYFGHYPSMKEKYQYWLANIQ